MKETLLFWITLLAFLVFDNLIVVAKGKDYLSVSRRGRPIYKSRQRNSFAGRDVVFLNPINLFDRVITVEKVTLSEDAHRYKQELRSIEYLAKDLNSFAYLGYLYFLYIVTNCYLSFVFGFEAVVVNLLVGHSLIWICAVGFAFLHMRSQELPKAKVVSIFVEALFVPAYLVNLNKKFLRLRESDICALRLHIRALKRVADCDADLIRYELLNQTNAALYEESDPSKSALLQGFAKCLRV
jgi:hypothetical protein